MRKRDQSDALVSFSIGAHQDGARIEVQVPKTVLPSKFTELKALDKLAR